MQSSGRNRLDYKVFKKSNLFSYRCCPKSRIFFFRFTRNVRFGSAQFRRRGVTTKITVRNFRFFLIYYITYGEIAHFEKIAHVFSDFLLFFKSSIGKENQKYPNKYVILQNKHFIFILLQKRFIVL